KPLLFGANNRAVLGSIAACGLGLLVFVVLFVWRRRLGVASLAGLLAAAGGGIGGFFVAARFLPKEVPTATNPRKGQPFWAAAADAGVRARVINVPTTFPAEDHHNESMLSGLGVPDMRGRIGSPSFYTSDPSLALSDNQFSVEIVHLKSKRGTLDTAILGPLNQPFYDFLVDDAVRGLEGQARTAARAEMEKKLQAHGVPRRLDVPFRIEATDDQATIDVAGVMQTLRVGEWSQWFVVPIRVNPIVDRLAGLRGLL